MFFFFVSMFWGCGKRTVTATENPKNNSLPLITKRPPKLGVFGFSDNSCRVFDTSKYDFRDVVFRLQGSNKDSVRKELEQELKEKFLEYCKGACGDPKIRQKFLGAIQTDIRTDGRKICMMGSLSWNLKNDPSGFKENSQNLDTAMQNLVREMAQQGVKDGSLYVRSPALLPSNCMTGTLGDKLKSNLEEQLQKFGFQVVSEISQGVTVLRLELYDEASTWRLKVINVKTSRMLGSIPVSKDLLPPNHLSQCSADDIIGIERPTQVHSSGLRVQIEAGNRTLCEGEPFSIRFQANEEADFYLFSVTNDRFVKVYPPIGKKVFGTSFSLPTLALRSGDGQDKLILMGVPRGSAKKDVMSLPINCYLGNDFAKVLNKDYAYEIQSVEVYKEGQNGCLIQPLSNRLYRDAKKMAGQGFPECK